MRVDRIKEIRERRGYSQGELAKRCGMSASQIFRIESGRSTPSGDTVASIARELEVSSDYLLGLVNEPYEHISQEQIRPEEQNLINAYRRGDYREGMKIFAQSPK